MRNTINRHRDALAIVAALVGPLAVAAALVPLRTSLANTAAALILVAVVVAVAVAGNRVAGALAATSASAWFDFFLTRPYERFAISHRADIETAVSLLVVGIAVTELAVRNRRHHEDADTRMEFVAVIYGLAELVAGGAPPGTVTERARLELIDLLKLQDCRYELEHGLRRTMRIDHSGEIIPRIIDSGTAGTSGWDSSGASIGRLAREVELEVQWGGRQFGRFVMVPTDDWPPSTPRRLAAVAIADQVGAAFAEQRRSA